MTGSLTGDNAKESRKPGIGNVRSSFSWVPGFLSVYSGRNLLGTMMVDNRSAAVISISGVAREPPGGLTVAMIRGHEKYRK
jgi:hypothetical protein